MRSAISTLSTMNSLTKTYQTYPYVRIFMQNIKQSTFLHKKYSTHNVSMGANGFGILCDVDGVLTRGRSVLAAASNAFQLLKNENGGWRAPVLFLTNAGNVLKQSKAQELSNILKQEILPSDIVMSHTALRLYTDYFDKHVAVCGQGPIKEIARNLGFTKVSTIDEISVTFPFLDACRPKDMIPTSNPNNEPFEKIEAIVLLGEPLVWERHLQILLDLLLTDGEPNKSPEESHAAHNESRPHLPVFACSSDLVWAGEAPNPRIAHGSFLACLEALYEKMSKGNVLKYNALIGKPSPTTYVFAISQLNATAAMHFGATEPLKRVYCIGDNPDVDIYGANLYNLCLQTISEKALKSVVDHVDLLMHDENPSLSSQAYQPIVPSHSDTENYHKIVENYLNVPAILRTLISNPPKRFSPCLLQSILVLTGVYQEHEKLRNNWRDVLKPKDKLHQDFPDLPNLRVPTFVAKDVEEAVQYILYLEGEIAEPIAPTRTCPFYDDVATCQ